MIELFQKGGPLMWPILFCSVLALAIFLERYRYFYQVRKRGSLLAREVEGLVQQGKIDQATGLCQGGNTPLAAIFLVALRAAGQKRSDVKVLVEEIGSREAAPFERYLGLLATIATISPLLGLLGTVLGMIRAFNVIAVQGVGTPATLGGGISEALITTAAGLTVAIPTILMHRYLTGRADRQIIDMEKESLALVDQVGE